MDFQKEITALWNERGNQALLQHENTQTCLKLFLEALDAGEFRVARKEQETWVVDAWVKQGILLLFRAFQNTCISDIASSYDKIPLKCEAWDEARFQRAGFRLVPGGLIRKGAYISPGAVIMPSFINIGAYIGQNTMIDSAVRVGSCAQIGANCHLSDGVGIGGVLEPLQASPVMIEDNCFLGARCQIVEGVHIGEGSVLGMGVTLGASTKIVHRETGKVTYGNIPPYSVVVPGSLTTSASHIPGLSLACAVIVKTVDAQTRSKTEINTLLRD